MKRYFLLVLILLIFVPTQGQHWGKTEKELNKRKPTIFYHPFYNGTQIIEVDVIGLWNQKIRILESKHPRALTWEMVYPKPEANPILIRNHSGVIVNQYNMKSYSIGDWDLKSVKKSKKIAVPHRYRFIGSVIKFPNNGVVEIKAFNRFYKVWSETGVGFIDTLGQVVLPLIHTNIIETEDHYILWQNNGISRFTDLKFNDIIPPIKGELYLIDDYLMFSKGSKFGLMTLDWEVICEPIYEQIGSYSLDRAPVILNGKYGFINRAGELVIPAIYDSTMGFLRKNKYARVQLGSEWFDIDKSGKRVEYK